MTKISKIPTIFDNIAEVSVVSGFLNFKAGILKNNLLLKNALNIPIKQIPKYNTLRLKTATAFIAWGRKDSHYRTKKIADKFNKKLITIEDGFLRSLDSGVNSRYGASFIVDDVGVYFELDKPNRLENLILDNLINWNDDKETAAQRLIQKLIDNKLSKYNATLFAPDLKELANNNKPNLIIIDQVKNDASIIGAGANDDNFALMLNIAKANFPNHNIFIKAHPAGKGYFNQNDVDNPLFYLDKSCNPISLLEQCEVVLTVSSHMGFEALLLNKKVYNFGVNWYGGFGLTDDSYANQTLLNQVKERRQNYLNSINHLNHHQATITQLFYSAYVDYSIYADPASCGIGKVACDIDTVMDYLISNRNFALRLSGDVLSWRLSRWKVGFFKGFFATPLNALIIQKKFLGFGLMPKKIQAFFNNPTTPHQSKTYNHVLAWGIAQKTHLQSTIYQNAQIWCVEDGFIRSKGLGASLIAPLSLVCDCLGIYYNPTTPSDLENLLKTIDLNNEQIAQAQDLQRTLIAQKLSKYNVGNALNLKEKLPKDKTIRLVVGQVEDDASILNSLSCVKKNGELLAKVRADFPNDFIIYKPHPDVEAGLRVGKIADERLKSADFVASDVNINDCLAVCDVLHTISSQAGFEALLHGKQVVCYGLPFYAGFGLTSDVANTNDDEKDLYFKALQRRHRSTPLTVDALIYATLIAYPLYHLPNGYGLAQAWQVVEFLVNSDGRFNYQSSIKARLKHKVMQGRRWVLDKTQTDCTTRSKYFFSKPLAFLQKIR